LREDVSPLEVGFPTASDPAPEVLCERPLDHVQGLFADDSKRPVEAFVATHLRPRVWGDADPVRNVVGDRTLWQTFAG
jgi:hypothetical protein